jgi:hypothetical protein
VSGSEIDDGGPAFPGVVASDAMSEEWGMTLRDYFAGQALKGLLSNPKLHQEILKRGQGWVTSSSFGWADDMLKARKTQ